MPPPSAPRWRVSRNRAASRWKRPARGSAPEFDADRTGEQKQGRDHALPGSLGHADRSAYARLAFMPGVAAWPTIQQSRWSCWGPHMPRNFRTPSKRPLACVRPCRTTWPACSTGPSGSRAAQRFGRRRELYPGARGARPSREDRLMSVEITVLPSGLRVVTDRMGDVETASLGRLGRGGLAARGA